MTAILQRPKPYVMAHRGDSDHAPENTLAAFDRALAAGADIIETDLWFTRDGAIVCHHDRTTSRMTGRAHPIADLTLAEAQRLPITGGNGVDRYPDERIPSLTELLAILPDDVLLAVELKDPRFADPVWSRRLVVTLAERVAAQNVIAISFRPERLRGARIAEPGLATGYLPVLEPWPRRGPTVLGPFWPLLAVNPLYVAIAHRNGQWVAPLDPTPNARLGWYLRLGVDAILTNDPADLRARLAAARR